VNGGEADRKRVSRDSNAPHADRRVGQFRRFHITDREYLSRRGRERVSQVSARECGQATTVKRSCHSSSSTTCRAAALGSSSSRQCKNEELSSHSGTRYSSGRKVGFCGHHVSVKVEEKRWYGLVRTNCRKVAFGNSAEMARFRKDTASTYPGLGWSVRMRRQASLSRKVSLRRISSRPLLRVSLRNKVRGVRRLEQSLATHDGVKPSVH
jgi:hypothetical protein